MNKIVRFNKILSGLPVGNDVVCDTVLANPPYSTEWNPQTELLKYDDRFKDYGKLAPKSKYDQYKHYE